MWLFFHFSIQVSLSVDARGGINSTSTQISLYSGCLAEHAGLLELEALELLKDGA